MVFNTQAFSFFGYYGMFSTLLTVVDLTVNVLILWVSFVYCRRLVLCRIYAIYLLLPSVAYEIVKFGNNYIAHTTYSDFIRRFNYPRYTFWFVFELAGFQYSILANTMVLLCFLSVTYPVYFQSHIRPSRYHTIFALASLFSLLLTCIAVVVEIPIDGYVKLHRSGIQIFNILYYVKPCFTILSSALMLVLFVLSLIQVVCHKELIAVELNRKRLMWTLVYCTPPNVFMFLQTPYSVFQIIYSQVHNRSQLPMSYRTVEDLSEPLSSGRLFFASICVLFAFAEYRRAVHSAVKLVTRKLSEIRD